ncbi:MAG: ribonuclease P [Candidatus Micrarchaeota archaeon]|nr:ribonuclease P [Candidatus Micrarchaeota archaeon]
MSRSALVKDIASERMTILYGIAKAEIDTNPKLSRKHAALIRRISEHYKVRLPKEIRNGMCKGCSSILIPGLSASVRIASANRQVIYKCLSCKTEKKIPY